MYKTAIEYYREPVDMSIHYSHYKGPVKTIEKFTHIPEKFTDAKIELGSKNNKQDLHLKWKTEHYNNASQPNVWGPAFWFTLHNGSSRYPKNASPITIEKMKGYIMGIPVMLPCEKCKVHATNHIMQNKDKLDQICSGQDTLFAFFVDFHNIVNKRYNKPIVSVEEARKMYNGGGYVSKLSY